MKKFLAKLQNLPSLHIRYDYEIDLYKTQKQEEEEPHTVRRRKADFKITYKTILIFSAFLILLKSLRLFFRRF